MKKNSTYIHKPNEKYIVISKDELENYLAQGYLQGTGISKEAYKARANKAKQTNLEKYGTTTVLGLPQVVKARQSEEAKSKRVESRRQTYLDKYGVINNSQLPDFKEKMTATCIERYGSVENAYKIRMERSKQTCLKKYGVTHPMQDDSIKAKLEQSLLDKYGVRNYVQTTEYHKKAKKKYIYDNQKFDSIPELALYVYAKEHNESIIRNTTIKFEYIFNDKIHYYFPDFIYKNKLIEIKGDHFFEDGKMINPYDRSQDEFYQAKYLCGLKNGVEF